jgi:glycine cleavage system transcriptional repressor
VHSQKVVISILGADRPGIVAAVSRILFEQDCNIEDVNQTTLQTEFAGIFVVSTPAGLDIDRLQKLLQESVQSMGLQVLVKSLEPQASTVNLPREPFVITTVGPDRLGLVAGITEVIAGFGINITSLRAVFRGGERPQHNIMIYEVDVPLDTDQIAFRHALRQRAEELGLDLSLQHRDVYQAVHRV